MDEVQTFQVEEYVIHSPKNNSEYRVTNTILGKGSFGVVREVIELSSNKKFAAKILDKISEEKYAIKAFRTEASVLQTLNHPNVIKFIDFFEDPLNLYLIMEIIHGVELFDRIVDKNGFNEREARRIALKITSGIHHCHQNGIVHRDVKCENVMIGEHDTDVKLIDFGFSAMARGFSLSGQLGTPDYMAPEIWDGKTRYGPPVDLWALGVLVYILLVNYPPFFDDSAAAIKMKIIKGNYAFHSEYWSHISDEAKDFVQRLLTVDMTARMTAEEAMQHPWLTMDEEHLPAPISAADEKLEERIRSLMKKFRRSTQAVMVVNRFRKLYSLRQLEKESVRTERDLSEVTASEANTPRKKYFEAHFGVGVAVGIGSGNSNSSNNSSSGFCDPESAQDGEVSTSQGINASGDSDHGWSMSMSAPLGLKLGSSSDSLREGDGSGPAMVTVTSHHVRGQVTVIGSSSSSSCQCPAYIDCECECERDAESESVLSASVSAATDCEFDCASAPAIAVASATSSRNTDGASVGYGVYKERRKEGGMRGQGQGLGHDHDRGLDEGGVDLSHVQVELARIDEEDDSA